MHKTIFACMHAKSLQSCPTLWDPMDCSLPGSSFHGIFQARILGWVAMPSSSLSIIQLLGHVRLFVTSWTAAHQASLFFTNSQSLLKLMSIKSVMLSNHLILCQPILLSPSIFPSIRVLCSESVLCISWSKYWSFSFNISLSNEYSGLISFRMD